MTPSQAHKNWAGFLRERFVGNASVTMYDDEAGTTRIPLFASEGPQGLVAATIGLMDLEQGTNPSVALRTELVMRSRRRDRVALNVLSTVAFYVLKDGWRTRPGSVFEDMMSMYEPTTGLPHVLFTVPFDWDEWGTVALGDRVIHPLLAIPVSSAEADLAIAESVQALESLWRQHGTDVFNWERESVV